MEPRAKRQDCVFSLALVKVPNSSANTQPPRKKRALMLADVRKRHVMEAAGAPSNQQPLLMHGLSVEQYRAVYNTIVEPWASSTRPSTDNTPTALGRDLKHKLWMAMDRPKLEEVMAEDGRVEVRETFDPIFLGPDVQTD